MRLTVAVIRPQFWWAGQDTRPRASVVPGMRLAVSLGPGLARTRSPWVEGGLGAG